MAAPSIVIIISEATVMNVFSVLFITKLHLFHEVLAEHLRTARQHHGRSGLNLRTVDRPLSEVLSLALSASAVGYQVYPAHTMLVCK